MILKDIFLLFITKDAGAAAEVAICVVAVCLRPIFSPVIVFTLIKLAFTINQIVIKSQQHLLVQ